MLIAELICGLLEPYLKFKTPISVAFICSQHWLFSKSCLWCGEVTVS